MECILLGRPSKQCVVIQCTCSMHMYDKWLVSSLYKMCCLLIRSPKEPGRPTASPCVPAPLKTEFLLPGAAQPVIAVLRLNHHGPSGGFGGDPFSSSAPLNRLRACPQAAEEGEREKVCVPFVSKNDLLRCCWRIGNIWLFKLYRVSEIVIRTIRIFS